MTAEGNASSVILGQSSINLRINYQRKKEHYERTCNVLNRIYKLFNYCRHLYRPDHWSLATGGGDGNFDGGYFGNCIHIYSIL